MWSGPASPSNLFSIHAWINSASIYCETKLLSWSSASGLSWWVRQTTPLLWRRKTDPSNHNKKGNDAVFTGPPVLQKNTGVGLGEDVAVFPFLFSGLREVSFTYDKMCPDEFGWVCVPVWAPPHSRRLQTLSVPFLSVCTSSIDSAATVQRRLSQVYTDGGQSRCWAGPHGTLHVAATHLLIDTWLVSSFQLLWIKNVYI